jgi:hypothetical protein
MRRTTRSLFVGVVLAVAALIGPGASVASSVRAEPINGAQRVSHGAVSSLNWSGYAVYQSGTTFTHAQGDWTQPAVAPGSCPKEKTQLSSFFVGIDGYNSSSVEQIGTEADCIKGSPFYYAWYEMYPAPQVVLTGCALAPGVPVHAEVSYVSGSTFALTLTVNGINCSPGTVVAPGTPSRSSAEWIAEAPATGGHFWPLTDFQSVAYANASVTGNGTSGVLGASSWSHDSIAMVDRGRPFDPTVKASSGPLNGTGNGFTIGWQSS